ncbi:hypothetical protein LTS15_008288 [Exophiala xenobiotica]|nr:hypothetical protein LTS15_008288 [Exophiala xenobiotica]
MLLEALEKLETYDNQLHHPALKARIVEEKFVNTIIEDEFTAPRRLVRKEQGSYLGSGVWGLRGQHGSPKEPSEGGCIGPECERSYSYRSIQVANWSVNQAEFGGYLYLGLTKRTGTESSSCHGFSNNVWELI